MAGIQQSKGMVKNKVIYMNKLPYDLKFWIEVQK